MRKIMLLSVLAILAIALVGCAAGDNALNKIGIPRCMDDYKYVNGKCVPRPSNERPDLFSNSQAAIDRWDKEHAAPVVETKKPVPAPKRYDATNLKVGESIDTGTMIVTKTGDGKKQKQSEPKPVSLTDDIAWRVDMIDSSAEAKYNNKPIYIYFTADLNWCGYCSKMNKTLNNPIIVKTLNDNFITVKFDLDTELGQEVAKEYGANSTPMNVFLDSNGKRLGRRPGFVNDKEFFTILYKVSHMNKQ